NPFNQPLAHVDSGHLVASPIPECEMQTTDPLLSLTDKDTGAPDICTKDQLGPYFPLDAASCARPSICVAVGELGKVARTSDLDHGGGTWTVQSLRNEQGLK